MSRRSKRNKIRQQQVPGPQINSTPNPTPVAQRTPVDFGLLVSKKKKYPNSEAKIFDNVKATNGGNFANYDHERFLTDLNSGNVEKIRAISQWFYKTDGMYQRAVRYLADLYRYDYLISPVMPLGIEITEEYTKRILKKLDGILDYFDASHVAAICSKWAVQVVVNGAYYGYISEDTKGKLVVQDLPIDYCRSRFYHEGRPVCEMNVKYFDKITTNKEYREQLLKLFPQEIQDFYKKFNDGKLQREYQTEEAGWCILNLENAFKFNFYDNDSPILANIIPSLLALDEVQDLEKEKLIQQLQKILVQEFELDKNGQLPFDMKELSKLSANAAEMVEDAVGVSVLSTFAKVDLLDMSPQAAQDSEKIQDAAVKQIYDNIGISSQLFNSEGAIATTNGILTDTAFVRQIPLMFENFFNFIIDKKLAKGKDDFHIMILNTTIFNYVDRSNSYKDLTKLGFSRFLPLVALGHTQKEVISLMNTELVMLDIDRFMIPPFSSNTMSSDVWAQMQQVSGSNDQADAAVDNMTAEDDSAGRPELPDDQKSEKTIANIEAMG